MEYFDYEAVAREAGISEADLEAIKEAVRRDFPHDDMMWELHILRACFAIRDGYATVADALSRRAA